MVTLDDLSIPVMVDLIRKAQYIDEHRDRVANTCSGRVLATLFYEPSTRTRLSFEAAMLRLGGQVIGFAGSGQSSVAKGETVADTVATVSAYADIMAIRHPLEGAALVASRAASVPVVNAGDGGHMHPTQTLTDLTTIAARFGRLHDLTVGLCGDLRYGRTVHSLVATLCRFSNIRFVLICPEELELPDYVLQMIRHAPGCSYTVVRELDQAIGELDVLYMTRVQRERFASLEQYERLKDTYILDAAKMAHAREQMAVLHPLPRVNEIHVAVDADPRAAYFEQVRYGMLARMALIATLLGADLPGFESIAQADVAQMTGVDADGATADGVALKSHQSTSTLHSAGGTNACRQDVRCTNARCLSIVEPVEQLAYWDARSHCMRCQYCDHEVHESQVSHESQVR